MSLPPSLLGLLQARFLEQPREAQTLNCERISRETWSLCEVLRRRQPALPRCHLANGFSIHRELSTGLGGRASQGSLNRGGLHASGSSATNQGPTCLMGTAKDQEDTAGQAGG